MVMPVDSRGRIIAPLGTGNVDKRTGNAPIAKEDMRR
jgi:hypothetical protein